MRGDMASLFSIGYGSEKREALIKDYIDKEFSIALILAAVNFEWTLKRTILILGETNTIKLRKELEEKYRLTGEGSLEEVWDREIGTRIAKGSFNKIIGNKSVYSIDKASNTLSRHAKDIRGELIHGNSPPSKKRSEKAVSDYIDACEKLRLFLKKNGKNIDAKLVSRKQKKEK